MDFMKYISINQTGESRIAPAFPTKGPIDVTVNT